MHPFFNSHAQSLVKEIDRAINKDLPKWSKSYPWTKDALSRLETFVKNGKLIRGLLVVLAASPKNSVALADAMKVGAALEMIHSGILIQDDIMDRDVMRRGMPTVFTQYQKMSSLKSKAEQLHFGESMASCIGIVAYFLAMRQFSEVQNTKVTQSLLKLFGSEMAILGLAQMDDVDASTHHEKMNKQSALRMYEQKTGRYTFGVPLLAGFILSGKNSPRVEKLVYKLAAILGVIFQLQDDVLGVFGKSEQTGKSTSGDIRERKQTWLYFKTLELASSKDSKNLKQLYASKRLLTKSDQKWVIDCMIKNNVEQYAAKELRAYQKKALVLTAKLPLEKDRLQMFESLIDYLVTRNK